MALEYDLEGYFGSRSVLISILLHLAQYNAWCLNNGNHSTLKRGHEDWNRQIIWKMRSDLAFQWGLVEDEVTDVFSPLLVAVRTMLLDLKQVVLRESSSMKMLAARLI